MFRCGGFLDDTSSGLLRVSRTSWRMLSYPRSPARTPNRFRSAGTRSSVWGPLPPHPAAHSLPETEEEYVEYFQDRIFSSQDRQLFPLMEDLADWFNKTLGVDYLTGENFLDMIDNGVLVCHLARAIQERATQCVASGSLKAVVPAIKGRCWENAARRSFFSRDNMENFIQFCRKIGVHENLLFESDDLVLQSQPRNVVLCLLEVARLAAHFDVEPPGLIKLEKEIAEEESHCHSDSGMSQGSIMSWQFQASPARTPRSSTDKLRHSSSSSAISAGSTGGGRWGRSGRPRVSDRRSLLLDSTPGASDIRRAASEGNTAPGSDGVPSDTTEDDWSRGSGEDPDLDIDMDMGLERGQGDSLITELDRRVHQATRTAQRQCHCPGGKCSKLKVKKVGDGKYSIAGRNVFIRVLKGRHMMVRVGGGWDTLEHFLLRHDPCQVKVVPRDTPTNRSYLHIRAKYRSPPLESSPGRSPTHIGR